MLSSIIMTFLVFLICWHDKYLACKMMVCDPIKTNIKAASINTEIQVGQHTIARTSSQHSHKVRHLSQGQIYLKKNPFNKVKAGVKWQDFNTNILYNLPYSQTLCWGYTKLIWLAG